MYASLIESYITLNVQGVEFVIHMNALVAFTEVEFSSKDVIKDMIQLWILEELFKFFS